MNKLKVIDNEAVRIINGLGGNGAIAELFNLSTGAVSHWRFGIPESRLFSIKLLRPDLFVLPVEKREADRRETNGRRIQN